MVEKTSFMFLTGPEVIKAVTGEVIDAEVIGRLKRAYVSKRRGTYEFTN